MATHHEQIASDLRRRIIQHVYPPGSRLPAEAELAADYGVSRGTIRQALATLQDDGLVDSRQGARRLVRRTTPRQEFASLESFAQWAVRNGRTPGGVMLQLRREPATETEALLFEVAVGEPLLYVLRLRLLDGEPIMTERIRYVPWIAEVVETLPRDCPSLTEAIEDATGLVHEHGDHAIDAVAAEPTEVTLLSVKKGSPLLRHRYVVRDAGGRPFGASEDRYKMGTMTFSFNNTDSPRGQTTPIRQIAAVRPIARSERQQ